MDRKVEMEESRPIRMISRPGVETEVMAAMEEGEVMEEMAGREEILRSLPNQ
jgi:hypothetical protein